MEYKTANGIRLYHTHDIATSKETDGVDFNVRYNRIRIMAIRTGEFRAPKQGEWYLSGAFIEAYKAANDLSTEFYIAKLVVVNTQQAAVQYSITGRFENNKLVSP